MAVFNTCRDDQVRVEPRSVAVDHEVGEEEGVEGLLAEPVVLAVASDSLKRSFLELAQSPVL
jgi:hypothetical protein